ncbi:hypothetical protein IE53DRAFT_390106 [Violaceomyces palustris]|uniref:Uncharacterized protein n=1 Tax=Violaceomyces palustris TaxID=1673888 RepID=A0ACD0NPH8_9BASI|nr:hypothetical protein IE53DRAFT_390106 [Violaceomyces palustris]
MAQTTNGASTTPKASNGTNAVSRPPPNPDAVEIVKLAGGKPDQADNTAKLDQISKDIEKTQKEVNAVRALLSGAGPSKDSPAGIRRAELRAELDELRNKQAGNKGARGKVLDDLKALQDGISKKIKDLQAAKAKAPYKSVEDVDARISRLEAQVESGSMKLVEEKKALSEISQLKKGRRNVEALSSLQASIDADKAEADKLRATLDDPESKALSKRFDEIRSELDEIQKEQEKAMGSRSKLLDQRTSLSTKLDELYQLRRDRQAAFRAENDKYYAKVNAEREKRLEKQREERQAAEDAKRREHEQQLREDAALPAFAKEIEDCDVLINYFSGKAGGKSTGSEPEPATATATKTFGGKTLEIRKVEDEPKGTIVVKKGQEDESDAYFVGKGGKSKGGKSKKSNKRGTPLSLVDDNNEEATTTTAASAANEKLNVPLGTLSALLSLSIPPPTKASDVPRVIDNLKLKREYFVSNQERVTRENIEKVERMLSKSSIQSNPDEPEPKAENGVEA